jgi:hypothetical protein
MINTLNAETTVTNKHALDREYPNWGSDEHFVYIGRKRNGMHFGNPFSARPMSIAEVKVGSREESIEAFRQWLGGHEYQEVEPERRQWIKDNMWKLKGKTLVCFCHPKECHGDVYRVWLS